MQSRDASKIRNRKVPHNTYLAITGAMHLCTLPIILVFTYKCPSFKALHHLMYTLERVREEFNFARSTIVLKDQFKEKKK